jgi:diguanylate cyclase (GGDEF)-like protein/PAS domain S-box-containing protein
MSLKTQEVVVADQQSITGSVALTVDGQWISIDKGFSDLLGYSSDQLLKLRHDDLLAPSERERVSMFHLRLIEGRFGPAKIETQYLRCDGSTVRVEIESNAIDLPDGSQCLRVRIEDVAEREAAVALARETAENYRVLLQSATEHAIIRLDENGAVISWNPGAERILGYREDEIIGRSAAIFFTPEDMAKGEVERELDHARRFGRGENDRWQVRKDQTRFWASGITTPFKNEEGKIQGFIMIFCDLTDKKIVTERAFYLAHHDSLTGLPNRKCFHNDLVEIIAEAGLTLTEIAVMLIDLDHFKVINDSLGHHSGDQLLKCVAQRLAETVRKTDIIARLSGDEFGIICTHLRATKEAELVSDKLVKALACPFALGQDQVTIGASIGVTVFPKDSTNPDQLLINADLAMYRAKNQGRSTYVLYTEQLNDEAARRHALDEASRLALQRREFELYYQPQYILATNEIYGMEALLRWRNHGLPMVTTSELVRLADDTGLIVPLGEWVLRTACAQLKAWHDQGFEYLRMAINLSYRQIQAGNFLPMLDAVLEETGVDPQSIELEMTEGLLMENTRNNTALLYALKERGIKISVDDFGTGFSSLSYLKHFPVDSLKIDQSFVQHLPENQNDASITSAIIGLGRSLNLTVVAEGIETEQQALFLRESKCDRAQGFYFSMALPAKEIAAFLVEDRDDGHVSSNSDGNKPNGKHPDQSLRRHHR